MEERFSWIPFYSELAKTLLEYKNDRKPIVEFIYSDLSTVGGKSLVDYIHMEDGSRVKDIDPFSVFAIFNRSLKLENKMAFLQKFKDRFGIKADLPKDFDGIPTVNSQRAFFFNWAEKNAESIRQFWELFEGVVLEKDISEIFNQMVNKTVSQYSLTMILYWIAPNRFINLDGRNRAYLNTLGLPEQYPDLKYTDYSKLIEKVKGMMSDHTISPASFPELSFAAWSLDQTDRIWMYKKYDDAFSYDVIKMGSSAKGQLDFSTYKNKKALGDAYRKISGNTDVAIPDMYWKLIKDVKVGDIVVVFDSLKEGRTINHQLFGWGRITSDVYYDMNDDNPIQRKVEWHMPLPESPIKETKTNNTRYFHEVNGIEAANIMNLLGINKEEGITMERGSIDKYIQLLRTNKNLILTGAPGTGKTYLAKQIAKQLLKIEEDDELQKDKRFGFVQFHPSYDYTDYVEGLRPYGDSGEIGFERKDGVFKEFCKNALGTPKEHLTSFDEAYESLCFDIKDELVENVPLKSGKYSTKLSVFGKDTIRWEAPNSGNPSVNVVTRERLRKLYGEYDTIEKLRKIDNINDAIRDVIRGCNTTMYYAILQEILLRISKLKTGIYTEYISEDAKSDNSVQQTPSVFIIDEINRGEISKIFGELFFSIDPGYRGVAGRVKTQYQNLIEEGDAFKDGFYVPENVYIIGTMNDIDRSVESMDFAMRRRFAWAEVSAEESMKMLDGIANESEIKKKMQNLNDAILKIRGLGAAYQIGAAYFKKIEEYGGDFQKLWDFHLKGLLYEYLRGNVNAEEQLEELKQAYDK